MPTRSTMRHALRLPGTFDCRRFRQRRRPVETRRTASRRPPANSCFDVIAGSDTRSFLDARAGQLRDRRERRLGGVQAEPEVLVGERREDVGRLVPVRIPAGADLRAALVLAQADRRRRGP